MNETAIVFILIFFIIFYLIPSCFLIFNNVVDYVNEPNKENTTKLLLSIFIPGFLFYYLLNKIIKFFKKILYRNKLKKGINKC